MSNPNPVTKWKKGQSGNPKGRPKGPSIGKLLQEIGARPGDLDSDKTKLDMVMEKVMEMALEGQPWAVEFIANRTEGKAIETVKTISEEFRDDTNDEIQKEDPPKLKVASSE
jgi:hypothetical protein